MVTPPFLTALGLDGSADERAIRRAYAQRLKTIDPETDPAAFQALHEAFEVAKHWASSQGRQRQPVPAAEAPAPAVQDLAQPAEPEPVSAPGWDRPLTQGKANESQGGGEEGKEECTEESNEKSLDAGNEEGKEGDKEGDEKSGHELPPGEPPVETVEPSEQFLGNIRLARPRQEQLDPDLLGTEAFKEFVPHIPLVLKSQERDAAALEKALQDALADSRLENIQARTSFEVCIGQLLARGWQPGHHLLFEIAAREFHWAADPQRLAALGEAGKLLNQALQEQAVFMKASGSATKVRLHLIERLRDDAPSEQEVAQHLNTLITLRNTYPAWLWIVTKVHNLKAWQGKIGNINAQIEDNKRERKLAGAREGNIAVAVIVGIITLVTLFNKLHKPEPSPYILSPDPGAYMAPAPGRPTFYEPADQGQPTYTRPPSAPAYHAPNPNQSTFKVMQPYTHRQLQDVVRRIRSRMMLPATPQQTNGDDNVTYFVETTAEGNIFRYEKLQSSSKPVFDQAVIATLYQMQPLLQSNDHVSHLMFTVSIAR